MSEDVLSPSDLPPEYRLHAALRLLGGAVPGGDIAGIAEAIAERWHRPLSPDESSVLKSAYQTVRSAGHEICGATLISALAEQVRELPVAAVGKDAV